MRLALMLFVAALAVGCGKKSDDAKKDEPAPAPMPTEPTPTEADQPAPPEQPAQAEAPPTPEDFEPTADTEITRANMDEQLKTIEKDLGE